MQDINDDLESEYYLGNDIDAHILEGGA